MAGLSRSEYLASQQKKKSGIGKLVWQILVLAFMISVFPMILIFLFPFIVVIWIMWKGVKASIDLPEYQ